MNHIRNALLLTALLLGQAAAPARAQQSVRVFPDCIIFFNFTAAGTTSTFDNKSQGCTDWTITYNSRGFTVISIVLQSAPNDTGDVAGAFVTFVGTISSGINPNTATTQASTTIVGYNPWVRVNLATATGSGRVWGVAYGFKRGSSLSLSGTVTVVGPDANGSPPTGNPVQIAGWDGVDIRRILTDTSGRSIMVGGAAAGAAPSGNPVLMAGWDSTNVQRLRTDTNGRQEPSGASTALADDVSNTQNLPVPGGSAGGERTFPHWFDGTTWDRARGNSAGGLFVQGPAAQGAAIAGNPNLLAQRDSSGNVQTEFRCDQQLAFDLTGSGNTEIVPLTGGQTIRVCHVSLAAASALDVRFTRGTGTNCGTGTANVSGLYRNITALALDFSNKSPMLSASGEALCINQSAAVNSGGIVIFSKF